jgi:hypothetical protein
MDALTLDPWFRAPEPQVSEGAKRIAEVEGDMENAAAFGDPVRETVAVQVGELEGTLDGARPEPAAHAEADHLASGVVSPSGRRPGRANRRVRASRR